MIEFLIGYYIGSDNSCSTNSNMNSYGGLSPTTIFTIGFFTSLLSFFIWFLIPEAIGFLFLSILLSIFAFCGLAVMFGAFLRKVI